MSTTQVTTKQLMEFTEAEFKESIFITTMTHPPRIIKRNKKYIHLRGLSWIHTDLYQKSIDRDIAKFWKDRSTDNKYILESLIEEWMYITNNQVYKLDEDYIATKQNTDEFSDIIMQKIRNEHKKKKNNPVPIFSFIKTTHKIGMFHHYFQYCYSIIFGFINTLFIKISHI